MSLWTTLKQSQTPRRRPGRGIAEDDDVERLRVRIGRLIKKWEPRLHVHVPKWSLREMNTYWASEGAKDIWFNTKLADMPPAFVESIVVHELVHLRTDGHDPLFFKLMDQHFPSWRRLHEKYAEVPGLYNGAP